MPAKLPVLGWDEARELLVAARRNGLSREAAIDLAVRVLDAAFEPEELVGGAAGRALEKADGLLLRAALSLLWRAIDKRLA
jgi:hypothetical protein